ncbi:MAG: family 43 glycosylhydrolase [Bacilli bacterium]|jgi:hypothetical protein|nr:family 43 glycosylhydrolase [Bacilli bacterium]
MKQIFNPFLPLDEYVPDGEAHVFNHRVYLYGSHDSENGTRFCPKDYVVYSAAETNLREWTLEGVSYQKSQDPRGKDGKTPDYYAPDCVKGNDGRYYLYYSPMGPSVHPFGPIGVAVSAYPQGPFSYLGDVRNRNGSPVLKYLNNDPAVINDQKHIYLYYGWGLGRDFRNRALKPLYDKVLSALSQRSLEEVKTTFPSILSLAEVELEDDMLTIKDEVKPVLDSLSTAKKGTLLYKHPFYEAPAIRKFNDLYYLFYSSGKNNELAYATSLYPDRDFICRGVVISSADLGYKGNLKPLASQGTIHGGVEKINGKYYVFYHRTTNNTDFSRQAMAEEITMNPDGTFNQAEVTTQGLNGGPLKAEGTYPAFCCCNLFYPGIKGVKGNGHNKEVPCLVCFNQERYVSGLVNQTYVGFKYFSFAKPASLLLKTRGSQGKITLFLDNLKKALGSISLKPSPVWQEDEIKLPPLEGIHALYFKYEGKDKRDFLSFSFQGGE